MNAPSGGAPAFSSQLGVGARGALLRALVAYCVAFTVLTLLGDVRAPGPFLPLERHYLSAAVIAASAEVIVRWMGRGKRTVDRV